MLGMEENEMIRLTAARIGTASLGVLALLLIQGCGGSDNGVPPTQPPTTVVVTSLEGPAQKNATLVGPQKCGECHGASTTASRHKALWTKGRQATTTTVASIVIPPLQPGTGPDAVAPDGQPGVDEGDEYDNWLGTKHASVGVTCESCHGPGSVHVADQLAGTAFDPNNPDIIGFPNITSSLVCGQCHNGEASKDLSEFSDWSQSAHRQMVDTVLQEGQKNPNVYVRTCFRCHNSLFRAEVVNRGVNPASLTTDQVTQFAQLAAAQSSSNDPLVLVSTVNCGVCHDPHRKTGKTINSDGDDDQVRRDLNIPPGDPETSKVGPGATVDQYTSFNQACGQCHNARGADPSDAALLKNTARPPMHDGPEYNMLVGMSGVETLGPPARRFGTHAQTKQQCATCHMAGGATDLQSHTFTVKLDACAPCHTVSDAAARRVATQDDITNRLLAVESRLQTWAQAAGGDPNYWDYSGNGGASDQTQVPLAVQRARYNYYFVILDGSFGVHNGFYARYLLDVANHELDSVTPPTSATATAKFRTENLAQVRAQLLREASYNNFTGPIQ